VIWRSRCNIVLYRPIIHGLFMVSWQIWNRGLSLLMSIIRRWSWLCSTRRCGNQRSRLCSDFFLGWHTRFAALFTIIYTMTWLSCGTRRVRPKITFFLSLRPTDKITFFVMDIVSLTAYYWLMFTHASILVAWRGLGSTHAMAWCGQSLAPLRLSFGLRLVSGKIGGLGFVSSNSENISSVTFLKHKNSRK
jgi:hypothetical protein